MSRARAACALAALLGSACTGEPGRTDTTRTATAQGSVDASSRSACAVSPDTAWTPAPVGAAAFIVNRGTQGMMARIRWTVSPDSAALLVVEDPVGVENEPVPDGVLLATEHTGRTWRMDSVWSVAPSPDWHQVVVGRAVVIQGGQEQVVPPDAWEAPARRLREIAGDHPSLTADSLRAHGYPMSGMAVVEGTAVTLSVDVDLLPAPSARFASLDGWRVGWSCDGRAILVGDRPEHAQDDRSATQTRRVAWPAGTGGAVSAAPPDTVRWTMGPTIGIGAPATLGPDERFVVRGREIEGRAGRVIVRTTDRSGTVVERDVGPGAPLAATRSGRFILALAPRKNARSSDSPDHAVVYRVP